jgi:hypothetical protein
MVHNKEYEQMPKQLSHEDQERVLYLRILDAIWKYETQPDPGVVFTVLINHLVALWSCVRAEDRKDMAETLTQHIPGMLANAESNATHGPVPRQ